MPDVMWALDARDRVIACPSKPAANAVVLYLSDEGSVAREAVKGWAEHGLMVACVAWPGSHATLTDEDIDDLHDAADGLTDLASVVGVVVEPSALETARRVFADRALAYVGVADVHTVLPLLQQIAPV